MKRGASGSCTKRRCNSPCGDLGDAARCPNRPQERRLTLYFLSKRTMWSGPGSLKVIKSEFSRLIWTVDSSDRAAFQGRLKVEERSVGITIISLCSFPSRKLPSPPPLLFSTYFLEKKRTVKGPKDEKKELLHFCEHQLFPPAGCSFRQTVENLTGAPSL